MEFAAQLGRGERLVRWHRKGSMGPRELVLAPVTSLARRKLAPTRGRTVEIFTSLPVEAPPGVTVTENTYAWTGTASAPPLLTGGGPGQGTSLVETGVVDADHYARVVQELARAHGATRYFAHHGAEKLHRIAVRDRPPGGPARSAPGADRPARPHRTHGRQLPVHGRAHPAAGPRRHRGEGRRHRDRARVAAGRPRRRGAQGFLSGVAGTAAHEVNRSTRAAVQADRLNSAERPHGVSFMPDKPRFFPLRGLNFP
ncbi:hypothetical protein STANM309S_00105 [Streptomyces tanashiensis]